jgi:hypothetical protein
VLAISFSQGLAAKEVTTRDFSGWMDEYSNLVFSEELNAFVFFNEDKRGKYQKVYLDEVTIYSKDAKANPDIADQAIEYLLEGGRKLLAERSLLATEPGQGVLRYRMAITGVRKSKESLKPYHVVPVAAVFRGAQEASGKVAAYIDAMFEAELTDSVTGERAAAIVRRGIGATEKRSGDEMEFEDLIPTLDLWLEAYGETLDAFLAKR